VKRPAERRELVRSRPAPRRRAGEGALAVDQLARPRRPVARPKARRRPEPAFVAHGRAMAAGRALAAGLICFAVWLALDARQLDNSAHAAPLGVRRSVSSAILGPITRVQQVVGLDRVVDSLNRLLGRNSPATPAGGLAGAQGPSSPNHRSGGGHRGSTTPTTVAGGSKGAPQPVAFPPPSVAHPVTVLDIGDSIGEDLGYGLADMIGTNPAVHLVQAAQGNTGLADTAYYNWSSNLAQDLAKYHPAIVVALFGGNDWQPFTAAGKAAMPGTAFWRAQYTARVADLVTQATAAGAKVFWVGLPIMGPTAGLPSEMAPTLNSVYQSAAASHPGASYISIYQLFENAQGQYSQYLPGPGGNLVEVRDPDDIHIAPPAGNDRAATAVLAGIEASLHIKLH
jgi:hypothetical protein